MADFNYPVGIGSDNKAGQPWMLLTSYESKNAIENHTKIISSIALYIPPNSLTTAFQATWSETEGAATKAAFGGAVGRMAEAGIGATRCPFYSATAND